jgi:4-diphosphocytidyl-2C-methyl-D-erythritol kinase
MALNSHWGLGLDQPALLKVASKVGSDVPFSLFGGTALGLDTGIELRKLENLPVHHVVLLVSPIGLGTREVFSVFDQMFPDGDMTISPEEAVSQFASLSNIGKNSLFPPALRLREELAEFQNLIPETMGHLSGSGPTIYFITTDQSKAQEWNQTLRNLGHFTILTSTSNRGAELG